MDATTALMWLLIFAGILVAVYYILHHTKGLKLPKGLSFIIALLVMGGTLWYASSMGYVDLTLPTSTSTIAANDYTLQIQNIGNVTYNALDNTSADTATSFLTLFAANTTAHTMKTRGSTSALQTAFIDPIAVFTVRAVPKDPNTDKTGTYVTMNAIENTAYGTISGATAGSIEQDANAKAYLRWKVTDTAGTDISGGWIPITTYVHFLYGTNYIVNLSVVYHDDTCSRLGIGGSITFTAYVGSYSYSIKLLETDAFA